MSYFLAILLCMTYLFANSLSLCACNVGDGDGSVFFVVVCYNPNKSNN
jgi:hypothetical protein